MRIAVTIEVGCREATVTHSIPVSAHGVDFRRYKMEKIIKKLEKIRDSLEKTWSCQAGKEYDKIEAQRLYNILNGVIEDAKR